MSDLISRQAAIDVASGYCHPANIADELRKLPSAEPEPLTDEEQRIFLAAMAREENVCRKVHAEWSEGDLDCDINLVDVCHEIKRKVKDALWGI